MVNRYRQKYNRQVVDELSLVLFKEMVNFFVYSRNEAHKIFMENYKKIFNEEKAEKVKKEEK